MKKLDSLKEGDVLFLAGSIPASMPDDMYERIMKRLEGSGVTTVVDATERSSCKGSEISSFSGEAQSS